EQRRHGARPQSRRARIEARGHACGARCAAEIRRRPRCPGRIACAGERLAPLTRVAIAALLLGAALPAAAACNITQNGEYTNYEHPGCGDVILRFTQHSTNTPTDIVLGYPVPIPVDSETPVAGFRSYAWLLAGQQDMAVAHAEV